MTYSAIKYMGTALPTLSATFTLFTTVDTGMSNFFPIAGLHRFLVDIKNSHAGTLKEYKSDDGGTTWNQISETAIAAAAATATNVKDYLVSGYRDWKVDWVNGGTTQTTFEIDMSVTGQRGATV